MWNGSDALGARIAVSPDTAITRHHVVAIPNTEQDAGHAGQFRQVCVECASKLQPRVVVAASDRGDLRCIRFDPLPGITPAPLFSTSRLDRVKLRALGFKPGEHWPY